MSAEEPGGPPAIWPAPFDARREVEEATVVDRGGQTLGTFLQVAASYHSGPLPSPATLREYNEVMPGLGERIVTSWEEESRQRRSLERRVVEAGVKNQSRGQIVAATLAIIVSLGGIILLATGHNIAGLVALLPNLVGLVGLFLYNSAKNFSGG